MTGGQIKMKMKKAIRGLLKSTGADYQLWYDSEEEKSHKITSRVLSERVAEYGSMSDLENEVNFYSSKLRKTESDLKEYLRKPSFLMKKVNLCGNWNDEDLMKLKKLDTFIGVGASDFFEGDVSVKIKENDNVYMNCNNRDPVYKSLKNGVTLGGTIGGTVLGAMYSAVTGDGNSIDPLVVGEIAVAGGLIMRGFANYLSGTCGEKNPLSQRADQLEYGMSNIKGYLGE